MDRHQAALDTARVWQMHRHGASDEQIADFVNANGSGPNITAEVVTTWLAAEKVRRSTPIKSVYEDPESVAQALAFFAAELHVAKIWFEKPATDPVAARIPLGIVLFALKEFIGRFADMADADLCKPMDALIVAFHELSEGRVQPLLAPRPRTSNRPPSTAGDMTLKRIAVIALELAIAEFPTLDDAARAVAHEVKKYGFDEEFSTIKNWRAKASEGAKGYDDLTSMLQKMRAPQSDTTPPKGGWQDVVSLLTKWGPVMGAARVKSRKRRA